MDTAALLGIGGILGTPAGVLLGFALQERSDARRRLRDACEGAIATALESVTQLRMIEDHLRGRAPAPAELRADFGADVFRALARIGLINRPLSTAASALGDAIREAIRVQMTSDDAAARDRALDAAATAIETFRAAATRELDRRALRWRN